MLRATLKSLLARKVRLILSGLAVVLGVMFVAGSFVLTDTLGRSFDSVFSDAYAKTDVNVAAKPKIAVNEFEGEQLAAPLPAATLDTVPQGARRRRRHRGGGHRRRPPDRQQRQGRHLVRAAAARSRTGPARTTWSSCARAAARTADTEIVINAGLAKAAKVKVGDRVGVLVDLAPKQEFTLVGVFGYSGGRDSLGGVNEVAFTDPVAQQLMLGDAERLHQRQRARRRTGSTRRRCASGSPRRSATATR